MPVLSDLPSAEQAKILELYTRNIIQPRELVRINNSIKIPYYLNDSEIIQLEKIFNRYVVLDNGFIKKNNKTFPRKLLRSSHPIAASLNYFANNEAYNEASTYQRFIDIGSDIRRGKDAHHCCNLVDTARDANRYLSQSNSLHSELGNNIEDNLVNGSSNKINMCFKGAQNCKVKAKCAISVNSLYDVEISSIPKIFINHNIDILIAYMFLPLELLDYDVSKCHSGDFYKVVMRNGLMHFKFRDDYSFIYTHSVSNWVKYLKTTLIRSNNFDIVIEIQRSFGPLHKLVFRRIPVYDRTVAPMRCIPFGEYNKFIKVPNMRYVVACDFNAKFEDIPMLVVAKPLATNLYKFVTKAPDGPFCYERGASYLHGMSSRITIGKTVVVEESNLPPVDYDDVLFSIMFLSAIARLRRTQAFGKCMKNVDKSFAYEIGCESKFKNFYNACNFAKDGFYEWFKSFFYTKDVQEIRYNYNESNSTDFMMFTFDFFEDLDCNDVVDARSCPIVRKIDILHNKYFGEELIKINVENDTDCDRESDTYHDIDDNLNDFIDNYAIESDCITDGEEKKYDDLVSIKSNCATDDGQTICDNKSLLEVYENDQVHDGYNDRNININHENDNISSCDEIEYVSDYVYNAGSVIIDELVKDLMIQADLMKNNEDRYNFSRKEEKKNISKFRSRGQAKIHEIMDKYFQGKKFNKISEISIAPGFFGSILAKQAKKIIGYHYTGTDAINMKDYNKRYYNDIYDYKSLSELRITLFDEKSDVIICDIGDECHQDLIEQQFSLCNCLLNGGSMIVKSWVDFDVRKYDNVFKKFAQVDFYKPISSFSLNKEFYIIARNYNAKNNKDHKAWRMELYVICKRIIEMHKLYLSSEIVDNHVIVAPEIEFETVKVTLSEKNAKKFVEDYNCEDPDSIFYELNKKTHKELSKINMDDETIELFVHNAVFGSGKSVYIKNNARKAKSKFNDLIIVPTKALKIHYRNLGYNCDTFTTGLISKGNYDNVYCDECFLLPKHYFFYFAKLNKYKNLYLFGDHKQICNIDFNRVGYNINDCIPSSGYQNNISKRVPQDVCNVLRAHDVECVTTNKQRLSIFFEDKIHRLLSYVGEGVKIMTLRQGVKDIYIKHHELHETKTIHERQGGNYPIVVWMIEPGDDMTNFVEHLRVAMTRHTNALVIYGQENCRLVQSNIYNTPIETISERIVVPIIDCDLYNDTELRLTKFEDRPFFNKKKISATEMLSKIDKVINVYGTGVYFNALRTLDLPNVYQGTAKLNMNVFSKLDRNIKGKSLLPYNTCRVYDSSDSFETVRTLIGRYGVKTEMIEHFNKIKNVECLIEGLNKFLKHPRGSEEYRVHFMFEYEDMCKHFFEYLKALDKKSLACDELDKNMDEFMHANGPAMIKFFMKKQNKFDATNEFYTRIKYGQGINAWHKLMNVVYACFARSYSQKLKSFLKPNVFYQNGDSDLNLGNDASFYINNYYVEHNKYPMQVDNDFTEYDASQNSSTIEFETLILEDLGVVTEVIELYQERRSKWKTYYPGYASLEGRDKKHSGESFTIDFNTSLNMAICGYIYEFDLLVVAQFKGDDSNIMANFVEYTEKGKEFLNRLGFKTKMVSKDVSEFTGLIQTRNGPYPDLIRRLIKAFSKVFKDEEAFEEFKLSVHDFISMIDNRFLQVEGRERLAYYYNEILLSRNKDSELFSASDIEDIEDFMFNFKNYSYNDLVEYAKDSVTISSDAPTNKCALLIT